MTSRTRLTRADVPFTYGAGCGMAAYTTLAGVRFDRTFLDLDAIMEAYTRGRPLAEELFGPDVGMGGPTWAGNSYGHVNALGCELTFPEDSEVGHTPIYGSLDEGIRELKKARGMDFTKQGLFPTYLDLWERMKKAFPDHAIGFGGFKSEGPITTAWALRGHDFFIDVLAEPEKTKEYLQLVTESIVEYRKMERCLNGNPEFTSDGMSLADDVAAMISPQCWPEMVMPFLEAYYAAQTDGPRSAHIEDLTADHLHFLDELGLDRFDPSVSPRLTPALLRDHCEAPFVWRLNSTHYVGRSVTDIERWVTESVADGASGLTTVVGRIMCTPEMAEKVRAYLRAAGEVERLLGEGVARDELRGHAPA